MSMIFLIVFVQAIAWCMQMMSKFSKRFLLFMTVLIFNLICIHSPIGVKNEKLLLNINKCFQMNFTLKRSRNINFEYSLDDCFSCIHELQSVTKVKDLGVFFTYNMSFFLHIDHVVKKSLQRSKITVRFF